MAFSFGEIRAFTGEEIAWMQATMKMVDDRLAQAERDLGFATLNPFNYVLDPQRSSLRGAQELFRKDTANAAQLRDSMNSTVESGDTAKLQAWFSLANTIIGSSHVAVFEEALKYASTSEAVSSTASETARDIATPSSWPWWVWAVGGLVTLSILSPYVGLARRK